MSTFKKRARNPDCLSSGEGKRIDTEILGLESDADIGAAKKMRDISKLPPRSKMKVCGSYFLEIGDEEIQ